MSTPSNSRRSSKSGPSYSTTTSSSPGPNDSVYRSVERREKAKSSQIYEAARRRGSRQHGEASLGSVEERPRLKSRTNSAPNVERYATTAARRAEEQQQRRRAEEEQSEFVAKPFGNGGRSHTQQPATMTTTTTTTMDGVPDARDEDEVAGVVGAVKRFRPFQSPELSEPLPEINLAVLGAQGVGKSTFAQIALDLQNAPPSQVAARKISVDGVDHLVRLLEIPIEDVDIDDDDNTVNWPETIEDKMMPRIDGALTLFDVKDKGSLESVPEMLNAISRVGIPSALISSKCDAPPEEREVDPLAIQQTAKRSLRQLQILQTSAGNPETFKRALQLIVRLAAAARSQDRHRSPSATRRRAQSNAIRGVSPRAADAPGHARASSEHSGGLGKDRRSRHDSSLAAYGSSDKLRAPPERTQDEMHGSFLFEESASEGSVDTTHSSAGGQTLDAVAGAPTPTYGSESGSTFDELVDRLLGPPTSKADGKFAAIFLALYRKFAPPSRLLEAMAERFGALERNGHASMVTTLTQLRYLDVLEQWVGRYPGDFAFLETKQGLRLFITNLSSGPIFGAAVKEISADLEAVREDDDTNWAYCDRDRAKRGQVCNISVSPSSSIALADRPDGFTRDQHLSGSTIYDDPPPTPLERNKSSTSSHIMASVESAQKESLRLQPSPRHPLTKLQWRALFDYTDDQIARELTRMDWIMFSSIRPRDLIRQAASSRSQRSGCKDLTHLNRMIAHFNHLAAWVSNYILLRDKPKHRALMLEKFMRIARKLREMNNYNALGAVIAGIKSTAIYRLAATRDLIPPEVGKDWMKLEILMAPSRSHFAYRLAWENSSGERIPYMPLLRRDLVSAEAGNRTFIGDEKDGRINWKKFEIQGEVLVTMQKAQGTPYRGLVASVPRAPTAEFSIRELVLDVALVLDEDELFKRSQMLEATVNASGTGPSAKFKDFFKR